jgi:hypothetical protein
MKTLLTILIATLALFATVASASTLGITYQDQTPTASPFRYAFVYDVNLKEVAPVAGSKIGSLPKFLGLKLEPEVWAFAGVTTKTNTAIAGFAGVLSYSLSTNSRLWVGGGVAARNSNPTGAVGLIGFEVKF